jgi:nitroimidazol reductase NimA-like FMN-containing flavoprotein (pyridoxamine 5'-phosphate oxidase superfamily)
MRQADREITSPAQLEALLQSALVCRLAFHDGEYPYIVPLNYGYADGCLYFHCAPEGKKLDLLRQNPRVGFEIEPLHEIVPHARPCGWETRFQCVIGAGTAEVLTAAEDKRRALDVLMGQHYRVLHVTPPAELVYEPLPLSKMVVIRVRIERMTGKQSKHFLKK